MSDDMTYEEQRRLNAYIASENGFLGLAEEVAFEMIMRWLRRNLPHLLSVIRQAMIDCWGELRDWLGL